MYFLIELSFNKKTLIFQVIWSVKKLFLVPEKVNFSSQKFLRPARANRTGSAHLTIFLIETTWQNQKQNKAKQDLPKNVQNSF